MNETRNSCNCCEDPIFFETEHSAGQNHDQMSKNEHFSIKRELLTLGIAFIFFLIGTIFHPFLHSSFFGIPEYGIFFIGYLIAGRQVLAATLKNLRHGEIFDENFLMTIATIGAIITHNTGEAVAVMIFYKMGEILQSYSINKSRKSIQALLDIRPSFANVLKDNCIKRVDPEDVNIGDIFIVKPGEKVPLDGIIINNGSKFDTSPLTGESKPKKLVKNDEILAGFINISDSVEIEATKPYKDSSIAKIMHLVEQAEENKSKTSKFITKFARYYTPAVVFIALFIATIPPIFMGQSFNVWLYRAMIFLVISCPCALVISIPLGYFAGIGGASQKGILVKGANFLDILAKVDTILFDKTGTITKGNFTVTEIVPVDQYDENEMLKITAHAEYHSTHPIAKSIIEAYSKKSNVEVQTELIKSFTDIPAHGIKAVVNDQKIIAGNDKILHKFNIQHGHDYCDIEGTVSHLAIDGKYAGYLLISDDIKDDAAEAIEELRNLGVKHMTILSGDELCIVESIAGELNIENFYGCLLPEDKVEMLKSSKKRGGMVAFVGDGINDAPVIAQSDVGIVMGALGSDAAIETADVVLMTDSLKQIPTAIRIARKTKKIVWQNIIFVFFIKILFMILGVFGLATMWEAIISDVGVALVAIFNSTRLLHFNDNEKEDKNE